jgi:O-antigen/teichoic acid export membrane protein
MRGAGKGKERFILNIQSVWQTLRTKARSRFARNVGVLTLANFVSAVLSFVQSILVARWLGPELYGVAALVMSFPNLIYTFFDTRSADASVKYLSEFYARGEQRQALAMCKLGYLVDLTIAIAAFVVVVVTAPWAAQHIAHRPEMAWSIVVFATAFIPRALVNNSSAVLVTLGRFPLIAMLNILTIVLRTFLVLVLVLAGWQVAGVIWGNTIGIAAAGIAYGVVAYRLTYHTWGISWLRGRWQDLQNYRRSIIMFLVYSNLNALLGMIPKQLDIVLLGYFRDPLEVGYYKLARNLSNVATYLAGPLQSVTYPELARLWGLGELGGFRRRVRQLAWQVGVPIALVVFASSLIIPFVLPFAVGNAYEPAVFATQILLAGSAIWLGFFWLRPLYFSLGKVAHWVVAIGAYSIVFVLVALLVTPQWGYIGMAMSLVLVSTCFHLILGFTWSRAAYATKDSRSSI